MLEFSSKQLIGVGVFLFAIFIATDTVNVISNALIEWFPAFQKIG